MQIVLPQEREHGFTGFRFPKITIWANIFDIFNRFLFSAPLPETFFGGPCADIASTSDFASILFSVENS